MNATRSLILWTALGCLLATSASAQTIYVRRNALPGGDGQSWATALRTVEDGLAAAQPGDEVWVRRGIYRPGVPGEARTLSFELGEGVALYGGFAGNETALSQRDIAANPTVLSGDLNGNDQPNWVGRADNAYHVLRTSGHGGIVDGFTIRGGNAQGGGWESSGGAVLARYSVTLRNVIVEENEAGTGGGLASDQPAVVEASIFRRNRAGMGGAILMDTAGLLMTRCKLVDNEAASGAGLQLDFQQYAVEVKDCLFAYNSGPAINLFYSDVVLVRGSTIAFNDGAAIGLGGGGFPGVVNSIVWGNASLGVSTNAFNNTAYTGAAGPWGQDPRFNDPVGPDGIAGTEDDDFSLSCLSPYIDAGNNSFVGGSTLDLAGNPRFADDPATPDTGVGSAPIVDLGPYEFVCACDDVTVYCTSLPNTSGLPALISWSGSTSISTGSSALHVEQAPPSVNGVFFYGTNQVALPFGDGIRCVGGASSRFAPLQLDGNGEASQVLDFTQAPLAGGAGQVLEGLTWNFQFYFRDPSGGPAGWNTSNAVSVSFCR